MDEINSELLRYKHQLQELEKEKNKLKNHIKELTDLNEVHQIVNKNLTGFYIITDLKGNFTYVCDSVKSNLGYTESDISDMQNIYSLIDPDLIDFEELWEKGELKNIETKVRVKSDNERTFLMNAKKVSIKKGKILFTFHDISNQKQTEDTLHQLNRELQAISNCNQTLLRAKDEQTLLNDICHIICDEAGYRLVWVGYAENDDYKTLRPVAWAGIDSGYIENAKLSWSEDTERGCGPAGISIRSGEKVFVQDFSKDPLIAPWRESALQRGYHSGIALPLKDENAKVFGVLLIYSGKINTITPDEILLLEELAGDLAFGITVLRTRLLHKQAEDALQESERRIRLKLDAILSPEADISVLELSDIIDCEKIQKLMDKFYKLTHIGIGIIDFHGKVIVGTGWQEICTKFHRVNPESCRF
ncbi:MAG: GAF domain-containing protein [Candidatus Cloacimonetes bacterium]|nr:GAF domain-containing protein [Candidatus Cloacimonadota bacterium]